MSNVEDRLIPEHRAMPNPGTEVPVRITGEALRHLRTLAAQAASRAQHEAETLTQKASLEHDAKLHKAYLAVAKTQAEAARIARGLADELDRAHRGQDPLVGHSIDDNRRADQAADLAHLRASLHVESARGPR